MKERFPAMLLIFATVVALVLNARGILVNDKGENQSIANILFRADTGLPTAKQFGTFGLAFFGYLIVVSFLSEREAIWFTGLLALGALYYNAATHPEGGVIPVLFGGVNAKTS